VPVSVTASAVSDSPGSRAGLTLSTVVTVQIASTAAPVGIHGRDHGGESLQYGEATRRARAALRGVDARQMSALSQGHCQ
jgi:hypothetical protein